MSQLYTKTIIALLITITTYSQNNNIFCKQLPALKQLIEKHHYKSKPLNDNTSGIIFETFISLLDQEKELFTQADINLLKVEKTKLDDYITDNNCLFINKFTTALENKINDAKNYLETLKKVNLDYNGSQTLCYIPDNKHTFCKTKIELQNLLQKKISYKTIIKLLDNNISITKIEENFNTLEKQAKIEVVNNEICLLDEIINAKGSIKNYVEEAFLNAYLQANDPNSNYFNNTKKTSYLNDLSKNKLSFGIITQKNNTGDIIIEHIIPGSAAHKNGKIKKDDIIKSLSAKNNKLETTCISNESIESFTNNKEHNTIVFSIKKKNGTIQNITLTKSKIEVQLNIVRGYKINTENNKIGYIKIPSFYTNQESPNGLGLSADIAKEIYKLQKENINGLILDLRYNGGGSMQEAIELSGMFIDRGPISIITAKNNTNNYTIRDNNRGVLYNKALVILINEFSASASELFAGVIQDYNRGIIIGTKTYGKSSAQTIYPLIKNENLGYSKITTEMFYRVNGKSHQSIGIIPDIILPSLYDNFEISEKHKKNALDNDTITVTLKHRANTKLNFNTILKNNINRVQKSNTFINIKKANKQFHNLLYKKGEPYKLTLKNVNSKKQERENIIDEIFNINSKIKIEIEDTNSTKELLNYNETEKKENQKIKKELAQDIYIQEAQNILTDYIKQNKQ